MKSKRLLRTWALLGVSAALLLFLKGQQREFLHLPLSPVLFGADGSLLAARLASDQQWRFPFSGVLPRKYLTCLVLSEDRNFFWHHGVDGYALLRALYLNLRSGRTISGGSTLTMQLVRIWRRQPRTYREKLQEILLAWRMELFLSKERILELYAANAPFGGNVVGLDAASWLYFQRPPGRLSWAESALLAILPNNPALLHPGGRRGLLLARRNRLLKKLLGLKIISELECELALREELPRKRFPPAYLAHHLLDTLLVREPRRVPLYSTFIEPDLQQAVRRITENYSANLRASGIGNASVIVIDNRRAGVVAYIGNSGVGEPGDFGQFVDVAASPRSSGSILKPLLYAAMVSRGELTPWMLLPDVPTHYSGLIVENYDRSFRGAIPAYRALAYSLNVTFVGLLREFGVARFHDQLRRWGFSHVTRSVQNYGLSLILGGAEVELLEVARAYAKMAQLANGSSEIVTPRLLRDEPFRKGELPEMGSGAAYLTMAALALVNRPGEDGFWRNFSSSQKVSFKTGTSYGLRDAWAVGCNALYTVAVWTGNADGRDNPELTGVSKAAPLMFLVFNRLGNGEWFRRPETKLKPAFICRQSGYLATENCQGEWRPLPQESNFNLVCPFHKTIHLDKSGKHRVDSRCYPTADMISRKWFVLPPAWEHFYQRSHSDYQLLPPWLPDCEKLQTEQQSLPPFSLIYPQGSALIFLPVDIDGQLSSIVLKAVHRHPDKTIFWYLDDEYIDKTVMIHELLLQPERGEHRLTLVDEDGNRLQRKFRVERRTK